MFRGYVARSASASVCAAPSDRSGAVCLKPNGRRSTDPGENSTARSIKFCSSRIFPGKSCACSTAITSSGIKSMGLLRLAANFATKNSVSARECPERVHAAGAGRLRNDIQAVEQVCAKELLAHQLPEILIGRRHYPHIDPDGLGAPKRSNSRSCSALSSLGWSSSGMSPISSRKSVPPSACCIAHGQPRICRRQSTRRPELTPVFRRRRHDRTPPAEY